MRDLEAIVDLGAGAGFAVEEVVEMPARNLSVVLRKQLLEGEESAS